MNNEQYEILTADRSYSNECKGKEMFSCIANNGVVVCYFPTEAAHNRHAKRILAMLIKDAEMQEPLDTESYHYRCYYCGTAIITGLPITGIADCGICDPVKMEF